MITLLLLLFYYYYYYYYYAPLLLFWGSVRIPACFLGLQRHRPGLTLSPYFIPDIPELSVDRVDRVHFILDKGQSATSNAD